MLERSAKLAPDAGASKWLYLGQLQEGWHALQSFSKGAEVLRVELAAKAGAGAKGAAKARQEEEGQPEEAEVVAIRNQLCSAQCSIAELYLTDLCFEEDAEARCQAALDEAVLMDQGSPEVSQALANLRLSQQRGDEAAALMLETYRRLKECHSDDNDNDDDDDGGAAEAESMEVEVKAEAGGEGPRAPRGLPMPSVMFRVQTAKLLLECQPYNGRCARRAARVLEQCKCEDDEQLETWYLLGMAYFTQARPDLALARAHLQYAQEALVRQQREHARAVGGPPEAFPLADQLRLVREQLALVEEAGAEAAQRAQRAKDGAQDDEQDEDRSSSSSSSGGDSSDEDGGDGIDEDEEGAPMAN